MRTKVLVLSVVTTILFIWTGLGYAFQNEPEGFRGLKWGDPPGEDMIDERKHKDNADWVWYDRSEEFLQIGKATLWRSPSYGFYKGKFFYVSILIAGETRDSNPYELLKDVLILEFGRGVWKPLVTSWFGDTTTVKLDERRWGWGEGVLDIYSTAIYLEKQRDERAKAEAEARRKEEEHWRIKDPEAAQEGLDAFFDYIPETKEEENKEPRETLEKPEIEYLGPAKRKEEEAPKGRGCAIEGGRKIEKQVEPPYPEWAQREGKTGVVRVKCWVLPSGDVRNVEVYQSSGLPRLDEHVCQYLLKWKFEPIEGQEIQWGIVPFHFEFPKK